MTTRSPRGPDPPVKRGNPSDYLANERTYLAWLRTAIALLSFGVTLNRFSIYLQQSDPTRPRSTGLLQDSANVGVGMVALGMIALVAAAVRYNTTTRQIEEGTVRAHGAVIWTITIAVLLLGGVSLILLFRH